MATALNDIAVIPNGAFWSEVIRGTAIISIDQAYFWTSTWQSWEDEADQDLKKGRYADFRDIDSLLEDLHLLESEE